MRILLAEDDRVIADGLGRSLRQSGYAVDWVATGNDADHALVASVYDLVILDIGLPKLSGLDVLKRLRARKSQVPVLILTALDGTSDRPSPSAMTLSSSASKMRMRPSLFFRLRFECGGLAWFRWVLQGSGGVSERLCAVIFRA